MNRRVRRACAILLLATATGCGGGMAAWDEPLDYPTGADLELFETGPLRTAAGSWRVTFSEIRDSRCPKGVQCVWEGEAVAVFQVVPHDEPDAVPERLMVTTRRDAPPTLFGGSAWVLVSVTPYPRPNVVIDPVDYRVILEAVDPASLRPKGAEEP